MLGIVAKVYCNAQRYKDYWADTLPVGILILRITAQIYLIHNSSYCLQIVHKSSVVYFAVLSLNLNLNICIYISTFLYISNYS